MPQNNAGAVPFVEDFLQQIINVHWAEASVAWLLINANVSGSDVSAPPPFGSFSFAPPKGTSQLDQQQVTKSQGGGSTPNLFFFPWYTLGAVPPTQANYRTVPAAHAGNLLFAWSVTDTLRAFPDDPLFPAPDKEFWYSTAALANAAGAALIAGAGAGQNGFFFASLADFLANTFTSTSIFPMLYSTQSVNDPTSSFQTNFNMKFLFKVPAARAPLPFTIGVPGSSTASGWASIFTPTKTRKSVKLISDLSGLADQTVKFTSNSTHTFNISTTGTPGQGTVSVDGLLGTTPGLDASAPFSG